MTRRRHGGTVAAVAAAALLALAGPTAAPAGATTADPAPRTGPFGEHVQKVPKRTAGAAKAPSALSGPGRGANPSIALLPDPSKADGAYWRAVLKSKGQQRALKGSARAQARADAGVRPTEAEPLLVDEAEPDEVRGGNDTRASAQAIPRFGSGERQRPAARILGTLAPGAAPVEVAPSTEDDGAIPLAGESGVSGSGSATTTTGTIGDGPHGTAGDGTGDSDFYALRGLKAGQRLVVDTDTPDSDLDSVLVLWNAAGTLLTGNDDDGQSLDSRVSLTVPADGDYFASVSGFFSIPEDPFDPASGGGAGSEGTYRVTFGVDANDVDSYSFTLREGDVLGASVAGTAADELVVLDPAGRNVIGSQQDPSGLYPIASPLPGGGRAVLSLVAPRAGRYTLQVTGGTAGTYDTTLEVYRPGPEHLPEGSTQKIFLDFDGARVNTAVFGGPGQRRLSPLSAFVGRWGLSSEQEDALIDQVVATTTENLKRDFGDAVDVQVLNSRDHADPWGQDDVSRIIVGGTIAESGVSTIGIAQSIDPGNFETEETALVLLDLVSEPSGPSYSFNTYLRDGGDPVRFVGQALGNIVSHEAGHYLGSWHVDQFNDVLNLMDQGGNFPLLYGVGPDGVGGTADDPDVDFGEDVYNPNEGFTGIEDTRANTQWGLSPLRFG